MYMCNVSLAEENKIRNDNKKKNKKNFELVTRKRHNKRFTIELVIRNEIKYFSISS